MTRSTCFTLTNLYNNVAGEPRVDAAWGFSCLIERGGDVVLFDAGGDGAILLENARALDVDLRRVRAVVLSHAHWDHMGGLWDALRAIGPVELFHPKSLSEPFKGHARKLGARPQGVDAETRIGDGIFVLPEMGRKTKEQTLLLEGPNSIAVVTGCAHPGIVEIVGAVAGLRRRPVDYVLGGFHLYDTKPRQVRRMVDALSEAGVRHVSPSHCTGESATGLFAECWRGGYAPMGCGSVLRLDL